MKKNIFQKVAAGFVGVAVLSMALTTSAITTKDSTKKAVRNHVYVLDLEQNMYLKASSNGTLPAGDCQEDSSLPSCYISFDTDQGSQFSPTAIPAGGENSPTNGYWE